MLLLFQKKILFGSMGHFGPKGDMTHPWNSGSALRIFFQFLIVKETKRYIKVIFMFFWEKNLIQSNWVILGPKMMSPQNYRSALIIFFKISTIKEAKSHVKIILIIFSPRKFVFSAIEPFWTFKWLSVITLGTLQGLKRGKSGKEWVIPVYI